MADRLYLFASAGICSAMRRVVVPELLDTDSGAPREVQASLRDLRRINRWFGGASTTASLLRRVASKAECRDLSVLDVGAGPGEAILEARKSLAADGITVRPCLLDRSASHMPRNGIGTVVGDAMLLPFAARSFDVVGCSLFVHHLEPAAVIAFANDALRVSRIAVVINDLERAPAHLALVYAGLPLFRSRLTRHDSVASVRRAYTADELRHMLAGSEARAIELSRHYLFRLGIILWKNGHA